MSDNGSSDDDERYANESFENESDNEIENEIPDMCDIGSEGSADEENVANDDDDDDDDDESDISSVKINTGPIKRDSETNLNASQNLSISSLKPELSSNSDIHNKDVVPYNSSSEEDDVIISETVAEINTTPMSFRHMNEDAFDSKQNRNAVRENDVAASENYSETSDSSEEYIDEDTDLEFQKIQEMEEKYLQNIAKTSKTPVSREDLLESTDEEYDEDDDDVDDDDVDDDDVDDDIDDNIDDSKREDGNVEHEKSQPEENSLPASDDNAENTESAVKQISQTSFTTHNNQETLEPVIEEKTSITKDCDTTKLPIGIENDIVEQIAKAVANALNNKGMITSESEINKMLHHATTGQSYSPKRNEKYLTSNNNCESKSLADKDDDDDDGCDDVNGAGASPTNEADDHQNQEYEEHFGGENDLIYYTGGNMNCRVSSQPPSSINSEDYIFHANFIKQLQQREDKIRSKSHNRKSWSFSNERMREIDRHNQILLRKILTQKPTYNSKPKSTLLQKKPSAKTVPSTARLTTSAVNRKKQQRQIDLDNQVLKRKLEAITLRRRPLIS